MHEVNEEYLAACEARCAAATEGPWFEQVDSYATDIVTEAGDPVVIGKYTGIFGDDFDTCDKPGTRTFIAHARLDVPTLVAEVRRLRCELREALKTSGQYAYESGGVRGVLEAIGWQGGVDATVEGFRAENERLRAEVVRLTAKLETK